MHDDTRCIIIGGLAFVSGLLIGAASGVLCAPQSGERTRRYLRDVAEDAGDRARTVVEDTKQKLGEVVEEGKRLVRG